MALTVVAPRETLAGEARVAITPATAAVLRGIGLDVAVEAGAGEAAGFDDAAYSAKLARIVTREEAFSSADILLQVRCRPAEEPREWGLLRRSALVVGFCDPLGRPEAMAAAASGGISLFAMELVPRITRAQAIDALSSQASIAGYKAVLMAADASPKIFPMMMTAAGTLQSSRVFILGAGVAGLQAIATARRLGAVVSAFDVRAASREQVQSVGARFVDLSSPRDASRDQGGYAGAPTAEEQEAQAARMAGVVGESDVVVATAAVPGMPAPKLVTAAAVARMQRGSVIVDLAAERGGNCELTEPGQTVVRHGVTIIGHTNIAATVPLHASLMYANNLAKLLALVVQKNGELKLDLADEIVAGALVLHRGEVIHPRLRALLATPGASS